MKMKGCLAAALLAVGLTSSASAATLDFTALGSGFLGTTTANLPEATITSFGTDLFVGDVFVNSICAIQGSNCQADLEIDFVNNVNNLTFDVGGWHDGDSVDLSVFDIANSLLTSVLITANGAIDLSAFSGISRLFFDDSSTGAGVVYANFSFEAVPLPAALPLFGTALAGMGFIGWRRKRKAAAAV